MSIAYETRRENNMIHLSKNAERQLKNIKEQVGSSAVNDFLDFVLECDDIQDLRAYGSDFMNFYEALCMDGDNLQLEKSIFSYNDCFVFAISDNSITGIGYLQDITTKTIYIKNMNLVLSSSYISTILWNATTMEEMLVVH